MKQATSHIYASLATIIVMVLLLLLLLYITVSVPCPQEEEGIEVAFGDSEDGGGRPDAQVITTPLPPQPEMLPEPSTASAPSDNELMVQEDNSLELAKQREQEAKQKAQDEELYRRQLEQEAIAEAKRLAKEKALAEKRAREQEAIEKAQQMGSLFGQAMSDEGANAQNYTGSSAPSSKGNPVGRGFGGPKGGPTWTLKGRDCKYLPQPSNDFKEPGVVVVNIQVDVQGNVVNVSIGDGTSVSDKHTQQLALDAAKRTKFTTGDTPQRGTIFYTFKLN